MSGQAELLVERLRQIDAMIAELQNELPDDTVRHLQNFRQFLDETAVRIDEASETLRLDRNPDVEGNFRDAMRRHGDAMSGRHFGFLVHASTYHRIAGSVRELANPRWQPNAEFGQLSERADQRNEQFVAARDRLLQGYDDVMAWEKLRRDSIVEMAADARLVQKAVEHVTQDETPDQRPSHDNELFARVKEAAGMLYSGGRAIRLMRQLQDMIDRERHSTDEADLRVQQAVRLSHYQMAGEGPLQYLLDRHRGNDRFEKLRATRWADDYTIARQRMTRRLHQDDPMVSAADPVQRMVDVCRDAMPVIEASMRDAREMLRSLLPSVAELARKAAAESRRENAEDRLDQLHDDVQRVAESLVDRANRADLTDDNERELAVDADAAVREIQRRMEAVVSSNEERESEADRDVSDALSSLARTLERTADHFEAADAGEDLDRTREALRENLGNEGDGSESDEAVEANPEALDDARDEVESAEQLARSDPKELLRRLEERLQRDPPMQDRLEEIGERTVADVENAVRAVAEQEADLQRQLERSDSDFVERKRAVRERLDSIVDQARSVEGQWLATAENASFRARDQRLFDRVGDVREELQDAIEQVEQTQKRELLMREIGEEVERLRSAIEQAANDSEETIAAAEGVSEEALYTTDRERQQAAKDSESVERRMLNEWVKSLDRDARQWRQRQEQATRRMQQNRNEQRSAENQLRKAEKQLAANPDQQWARDNVETSQTRVDQAKRAVNAADRTRQEAVAGQQEAKQLANEARKHSVGEFDSKNPAAELVARAAERSRIELERLAEGLEEVSARLGDQAVPVPPLQAVRSIAKEQQQARDAVRQAADDLERAARHEDRLGENAGAESLREVAQRLNQVADSTMREALESMRDAVADDSESSTDRPSRGNVGDQLAEAAERLAEQAETIAGISRQPDSGSTPSDAPHQEPNGAPENQGTLDQADQSEKLARTLDELDRQLNQRGPSATEVAGESNGDPSGDSGQQMQRAGQASSTLQRTASQAARKLAEQRQQALSQVASAGQQTDGRDGNRNPSDQAGQRGDRANPDSANRRESSSRSSERDSSGDDSNRGQEQGDLSGNQSGNSIELPGGGLLSLDGELRSDDQWGNLRERKSDNVIQDRKTPIPLSYRSAVEAYFQAIAAEAARGARSMQGSEVPGEQ
ncbi:IgA-specific metalloendopeptidase [Rhodopirellula sallentina SM41]|uniref:IgA-specific metalloendopeptidase n=1 Tax=Rhodopirellula sallentina SM41 TaxID=1263870 RepID=M5TTZ9_9BACT|nr:IgA-specific metalloendopeptidase [Rhodopirellula sallentina SM41]